MDLFLLLPPTPCRLGTKISRIVLPRQRLSCAANLFPRPPKRLHDEERCLFAGLGIVLLGFSQQAPLEVRPEDVPPKFIGKRRRLEKRRQKRYNAVFEWVGMVILLWVTIFLAF